MPHCFQVTTIQQYKKVKTDSVYYLITPFLRGFVIVRSSRPEVFCKKSVLENSAKFTGKHLCQSLLFNKAAGLGPATVLKKRL